MSDVAREMSLIEYMAKLPSGHRARKEYVSFMARRVEVLKERRHLMHLLKALSKRFQWGSTRARNRTAAKRYLRELED